MFIASFSEEETPISEVDAYNKAEIQDHDKWLKSLQKQCEKERSIPTKIHDTPSRPVLEMFVYPRKAGKKTRLEAYLIAVRKGYGGTLEEFEKGEKIVKQTTSDGLLLKVTIKKKSN